MSNLPSELREEYRFYATRKAEGLSYDEMHEAFYRRYQRIYSKKDHADLVGMVDEVVDRVSDHDILVMLHEQGLPATEQIYTQRAIFEAIYRTAPDSVGVHELANPAMKKYCRDYLRNAAQQSVTRNRARWSEYVRTGGDGDVWTKTIEHNKEQANFQSHASNDQYRRNQQTLTTIRQ
jgi:hypothetical protein